MRKALRLTAHATILTAAWVAVIGALVFNGCFLYPVREADDRPIDF
jgi:hypothetical protein